MALVELLPLGLRGEDLSEFNQEVKGLEPLVAFLFHLAREGVVPEILRFFVLSLLHAEAKAEREIFRAVWPLINVLNENVFDVLNK
jgi:hypothetical protein